MNKWKIKSGLLTFFIAALLLTTGCAPPWHGEENNHPVCSFRVYDPVSDSHLPVSDAGVTGVYQLERNTEISSNTHFQNYDSRLDENYDFLLPLDEEASMSSFLIRRDSLSDTIHIAYSSRLDINDKRDYDFILENVHLVSHTFDSIHTIESVNHPQIYLSFLVEF